MYNDSFRKSLGISKPKIINATDYGLHSSALNYGGFNTIGERGQVSESNFINGGSHKLMIRCSREIIFPKNCRMTQPLQVSTEKQLLYKIETFTNMSPDN